MIIPDLEHILTHKPSQHIAYFTFIQQINTKSMLFGKKQYLQHMTVNNDLAKYS